MILVGLAGWGDHDSIYAKGIKPRDKLREYSRSYPLVEVDSSFYAIQSKERMEVWANDTPEHFQFVVKAYQGMTGHLRSKPYYESSQLMYEAFCESIEPLIDTNKLKAVLFQYPPWFNCTRENVHILKETKERMKSIPCALEFRHQSWFLPEFSNKTLAFMEEQGWIHSICDEPQAGVGSVPSVLHATHPKVTVIRMHGRNVSGWNQGGAANWREVRYLYDYNNDELSEWRDHILKLGTHTQEVCIIFNNNSGGHAAHNATQLMILLGLQTLDQTTPEQLDLFE